MTKETVISNYTHGIWGAAILDICVKKGIISPIERDEIKAMPVISTAAQRRTI